MRTNEKDHKQLQRLENDGDKNNEKVARKGYVG